MAKEFSGKGSKIPLGSLRSFRASPPVLAMVAVTSRFFNPLTMTLGVEVLTAKPGVAETAGIAETAIAYATTAARGAWKGEENIMVKYVPKAGINSSPALKAACTVNEWINCF